VEVFDRIVRDEQGRVRYHYVLVDFLCRVTGGTLACASDAAGARWATLAELAPIQEFTARVIRKAWDLQAPSGI